MLGWCPEKSIAVEKREKEEVVATRDSASLNQSKPHDLLVGTLREFYFSNWELTLDGDSGLVLSGEPPLGGSISASRLVRALECRKGQEHNMRSVLVVGIRSFLNQPSRDPVQSNTANQVAHKPLFRQTVKATHNNMSVDDIVKR